MLLTTSLVSWLIMLDSNIVAVSLPAIGRSLAASFTHIQWVISAYVLTYAALLLVAGNFADLHGRRTGMLIGLGVLLPKRWIVERTISWLNRCRRLAK